MKWQWILVLMLLLFLVIFTAQNYEVVKIRFLFWFFETSRAIVIFSTLVAGIIIGWISAYFLRRDD